MSRKISIQEKKKWLEMFEQGKTENQIARTVRRDLRTINKGLQEASRNRHLANAEAEMLRNALFNHQNQLMDVLRSISNMLVLPSHNLQLREENGLLVPTPLTGSLIEQTPEKEITLTINGEDKLEWELLREHLKSDKLWVYIKQWRQAMIDHIGARWQFRETIKSSLKEETGLEFRARGGEEPEYLMPVITDLFYQVAINRIFGIKDRTDLEKNIAARDDESVWHGDTELARCKKMAECRDKILYVFLSLPGTRAAVAVENTYTGLQTINKLARRHMDEIMLLGLVTGKCRICTRLAK